MSVKKTESVVLKRGRPRKTNRQGDVTIQGLLQAAKTVLIRDGADGFSLERVAKEACVTKGTLLYHFQSKDNLLVLLTNDYVARLQSKLEQGIETVRASIRYRKDVDETVAGFIEWYRAFRREDASYTAYGVTLLTLSANSSTLGDKIRAWYANLFAKLRQSACKDALSIVLTLEGLFFLKHFQLDVTTDEEIELLLEKMEKML